MEAIDHLKQLFIEQGTKHQYSKGASVLNQGDTLDNVLLIQSGLIKITNSDKHGSSKTVAIFGKNHIIPLSWLFIEPPKLGAIYSYSALGDVIVYALPRQTVISALDNQPHIYKYLCNVTSKAYVNASFRIYNLQKTNVTEKVEFVLYYLATLLANKKGEPIIEIEASLTHQDIADIAGLSRESVTHLLSKARYREIYWKKGGKTYINVTKLDVGSLPQVLSVNM